MELTITQIGKYRIESELGRGGMAVVYHAVEADTNMHLALKVLPPTLATHDATLKRFIREGQNASRLVHENIVQIYEAGTADGYHYIAMELVRGRPLDEQIIENGVLFSTDETVALLSEIAAGLDYAHSQGIVHRDIKPANVLISNEGRVMLADFGVARQLLVDQTMYTMAGQSVGTPAYMSPEQARGQPDIDYRADVYSFGVLAYKLFTGRVPFHSTDQLQIMRKVVMEQPTPANEINPDVPLHISKLLHKCLAKAPKDRFESAGQFMGALMAGYQPQNTSINLGQVVDAKRADTKLGFVWYNRTVDKIKTLTNAPKVSHTKLERRTQIKLPAAETVSGRQLTNRNRRNQWLSYAALCAALIVAFLFWDNARIDREQALERLNSVSESVERRVSEIDAQALSKSGIDTIKEKADELALAVEDSASDIMLPEEQIGEVVNTVWYPKHSINRLRDAVGDQFAAFSEWISNTLSGEPEVSSSE